MSESKIRLPAPNTDSGVAIEKVMQERRSHRTFAMTPLEPAELGQLLWAAQGVTETSGKRTAPSAGALGPLEVFVVTAEGVTHYLPDEHGLETRATGDRRNALSSAAADQEMVAKAPAVLVITGILSRTAWKYGGDRAWRYVNLEAGHASQNVLLMATAMGLAGVPVGAFDDNAVMDVLGLPADHRPLLLLPLGRPA
ncbi:MAG: SagB/ThcOx family dehydrogenase [Actinobacteria bacterium]|nr:SagB/ThcOx family dehydrogenase [Actinomycetota bacterium]MBU1492842.1 SagB/ThcOx family dehydrogenase [Actinomycetota bacterium]MBU1865991.1 SagB/ThcOx family dehydrogenase [Actinomycetota bacterium]